MQRKSSSRRIPSLVLIHDGLGDLPIDALAGRTPLEAAHTPCMDGLIGEGQAGSLVIRAQGRQPGTDVGHLALFGQDPANLQHRRGPMEAAGAGCELRPGDVAVRFNFATIDGDGNVSDRRAGRIRDTRELVQALNQIRISEAQVFFIGSTEHRGIIVLRGAGLGANVSDSDPGRSGLPALPVCPLDEDSELSSQILNQVLTQARTILADFHTHNRSQDSALRLANSIIIRGAGSTSSYRSIPDLYRLKVACVSGEATVLGLASLSGFDPVYHESMTANLDTDLARKASAVASCLEEYDLVYLHLKGCDIAAHDRSPQAKLAFLERTDQALSSILDPFDGQDLCVISASDHATYCENGRHHWAPIPLFIRGPGIDPDSVIHYHEQACLEGSLGAAPSDRFIEAVFNYSQGHPWLFPPSVARQPTAG